MTPRSMVSIFAILPMMLCYLGEQATKLTILGTFIPLDEADESVYAYMRVDESSGQKLLVVLNMARKADGKGEESTFKIPEGIDLSQATLLISNESDKKSGIDGDVVRLGPWGGRIYSLA